MSGALLSNLQSLVAVVLLGLALLCIPRAYGRAFRIWSPASNQDSANRDSGRFLVAAVVASAVVRWLIAPRWIVTMFIGYLLTEQSIELSTVSHYGVASQALYHALFSILPRDHASLMWINSVIGVLTLPLSASVAARLFRDRRVGIAFALIVAFTPLFIKNDNSDANNVPCLLWLFGGLLLWEEFLDSGAREALLCAAALLSLAGVSRPEMPILVPLFVLAFTVCLWPSRARLTDPVLWIAIVLAGLLCIPHAIHVAHSTDILAERASLPGWSEDRLRGLGLLLVKMNTVLSPSLYPVLLLPAAALSFVERDRRKRNTALIIFALSIVSIAIYGLDLCRANMARVHVPGALLVTLLASAGVVRVISRFPHRAVAIALSLALAGSAIPTAIALWAPTNEQAEEEMIRAALAKLPKTDPYLLVRMAREDRNRAAPGSDFTHHHFPDYLFRAPAGSGRVSAITDWLDDADDAVPAYFYLGMRCYAEFRDQGDPPPPRPHGDNLQPACADMRKRFLLEPIVEKELPNRGDVWLDYYGDAKTLKLGLYRIRKKSQPKAEP